MKARGGESMADEQAQRSLQLSVLPRTGNLSRETDCTSHFLGRGWISVERPY